MYSPLMPVHWSRAGLREMPSHKSGQARHGLSYVGCKKKTIWARHMLSHTHILTSTHHPSIHTTPDLGRNKRPPPSPRLSRQPSVRALSSRKPLVVRAVRLATLPYCATPHCHALCASTQYAYTVQNGGAS